MHDEDKRLAAEDLQAVAAGARQDGLGRGEQQHVAHPEIEQDLGAHAVVAQDVGGLADVRPAIALGEPVRVAIADEHRHARAVMLGDGLQGARDIVLAGLDVAQHVGGHVHPVHAHQRRLLGIDLAAGEDGVLGPVEDVAVDQHAGAAAIDAVEGRLQHPLHLALGAPAVGDQVGDGPDLQAVQLGEGDEVGQARHRAVVVHDLADDPGGLQSGQARDDMSEFDAAEIAHDVGELYEPLAEEKGIALKVEADAPAKVKGNRELVSQALANLVDNAIKYTEPRNTAPNGATPEIVVRALNEGDRILLTVADSGPGIPEGDRRRVVERFVRLEQSRSQPGSGLGLSLASAVARLHGGELILGDNQPGLKSVIALPRGGPVQSAG